MSGEYKIRVIVIDDNDIVRKSLIAVLQQFPDLELIGEAADGATGLSLVSELHPNIVLINLVEITNVVDTTLLIRQSYPDTQVIISSSSREYRLIHEAFKAGAINYVLNDIVGSDLAEAIRQAHIGQTTLAPEAVAALMVSIQRGTKTTINLSKREQEVLGLMAQGLNNPEIAIQLVISRSTVKNHINNIFSKLNVTNRVKAVIAALQLKLLDKS